MAFDPDSYLKDTTDSFNPDAYLATNHEEEKPGFMAMLGKGMELAKNALTGTPSGVGGQLQDAVQKTFDKGGEALAMTLAGPGLKPAVNPALPFPLNVLPAPATHGEGIKTSPGTAAAIGTAFQMAPDIAASLGPIAEEGLARRANDIATREAAGTMQEVTPGVKVLEAPPRPTAPKLEPLPPAADIKGVSAKAAESLQGKLAELRDTARTQYAEGLKQHGINMDQPTLKIRSPEEIQADFQKIQGQSQPKVSPPLSRDPEMEKIFGVPKPEATVTPAMDPTERFKQLWQMDKELSQNIDFSNPGSQQGLFNLQKQIRAEMDALPQASTMNPLRDNYAHYKALTNDLGKPLQDPNQQAALLARMAKNGMKDVVPVGDAAKTNALAKFETETGSKILDPVRSEVEKDAALKAAQDRNENVSKAFAKEQKAQASRDAQSKKGFDKLSKQKDQQDALDARLKKQQNDAIAAEIQARKDRVSQILKYGAGAGMAYKGIQLLRTLGGK